MDLYAENILDHYRHPRGKELLADPSGLDHEANHTCGDELTVTVQIQDNKLTAIGWGGNGCAISQAGISILTEELTGWLTDDILKLQKGDVYDMLAVPIGPRRYKCALIGLHTLKNAIRNASGDEPLSWLDTVNVENE